MADQEDRRDEGDRRFRSPLRRKTARADVRRHAFGRSDGRGRGDVSDAHRGSRQVQRRERQYGWNADPDDDGDRVGGQRGTDSAAATTAATANRAQKQQQQQQENSAPGRATVMTLNNEVIQIATQVSASDLAIPAGFQQKN